MKTIETVRLTAKPFSAEDQDMIYQIYSDEEILEYTPYDSMDHEESKAYLAKIIRDWEQTPLTDLEFLMTLKESDRKTGRCGIHIDAETDSAMIGVFLLKEAWNMGYATEIMTAMKKYCFDVLGVHRVYGLCNPENTGSRRIMEKIGMRREAHFRKKCRYVKKGVVSWHDELVYAALKEDE